MGGIVLLSMRVPSEVVRRNAFYLRAIYKKKKRMQRRVAIYKPGYIDVPFSRWLSKKRSPKDTVCFAT